METTDNLQEAQTATSLVTTQQDMTRAAEHVQGESSGGKGRYFAEHTYAPGSYQMRISNNLCAIQVVGDMPENGMTSQLTSVTFKSGLFQVMPSCFMNCEQLQEAEFTGQTKWIGDYAFYGCKNLAHANVFTYPKQTQINTIGAHSFQGTGLTDIAVDLTASTYDTGIGEYAFADCVGLKDVRLTNAAYIGHSAFRGCTALTSVQFPSTVSYPHPEAFSGCASLASVTIPSRTWMLNDGMFRNCGSLTAVDIQDSPGSGSQMEYLGAGVFSGCDKLTSLTVPASISSLFQINENFLSGSAVRQITFNGIRDDVFATEYVERRTTKVNGYVSSNSQQYMEIAEDAVARHIPIVIITIYDQIQTDMVKPDCEACRNLANQLASSAWLNFMSKYKDKCYFVLASFLRQRGLWKMVSNTGVAGNPLADKCNFSNSGRYAKFAAVYVGADGKSRCVQESSEFNGVSIVNLADQMVQYADNQVTDETTVSVMVSNFGSPLDYIVAYSNTGKEYRLSANSQVNAYTAPVVDAVTVSDFKTGVWYYNAKELKEYADETGIPVFAEFSDRYCKACVKFRSEIYERSEFQEWVAKQPYLFCRIETEYYDEFNRMFTQPYFIRTTWAKNARMAYPGMIFYRNGSQASVWEITGYGDNPVSYTELQDMITRKLGS